MTGFPKTMSQNPHTTHTNNQRTLTPETTNTQLAHAYNNPPTNNTESSNSLGRINPPTTWGELILTQTWGELTLGRINPQLEHVGFGYFQAA